VKQGSVSGARHFAWLLLLVLASGCASQPKTAPHYATLQDYLMAEHRDLLTHYRHAEPDKLMQCYANSAMQTIPPELQPDVLAVANKSAAGQSLTAGEQELKEEWLDARPRPEGDNVLNVETPRALEIVRVMATTCWGVRLS
jgi:hypothetical protein